MSILVLVLGIFVFKTSYDHHKFSKELVQLESQIINAEENIHLLHAEWSLINSPKNIQALCQKLLPELKHTHYQLASLRHLDTIAFDSGATTFASTDMIQTASNE